MWNDFPSFPTCNFYIFPFFTPGKQPYFEISEMTTHTPMNRARDNWWTLDLGDNRILYLKFKLSNQKTTFVPRGNVIFYGISLKFMISQCSVRYYNIPR
jgi:hypothetical protein